MNEKSLGVLNQYKFDVYKTGRGRGGMILNTSRGIKMLYECDKADIRYEFEDRITQALVRSGFVNVDAYFRNKEGDLISVGEDKRKYIVKEWFDGRDCDIKNLNDVCLAIKTLAELHMEFDKISGGDFELPENIGEVDYKQQFSKHTKELKMIYNYLRNKKKKNEFERTAQDCFDIFYEEALKACEKINSINYDERFEDARKRSELCHCSYNYHNILFTDRFAAVTNFDRCKIDCQIADLYQFMRKLLEKNGWDLKLAYKMLNEYDKVKPISNIDIKILAVLFTYPEKFWKIINYYFNSNKTWIPRKSIEKLEIVIQQNALRENFVDTIA